MIAKTLTGNLPAWVLSAHHLDDDFNEQENGLGDTFNLTLTSSDYDASNYSEVWTQCWTFEMTFLL